MTDRWQEGWQAGFEAGMAEAKRSLCTGCKNGYAFHATARGWHDADVDGGHVTQPCGAWALYDPANPVPACRACSGSGNSTQGRTCYPCGGSGLLRKQITRERNAAIEAAQRVNGEEERAQDEIERLEAQVSELREALRSGDPNARLNALRDSESEDRPTAAEILRLIDTEDSGLAMHLGGDLTTLIEDWQKRNDS